MFKDVVHYALALFKIWQELDNKAHRQLFCNKLETIYHLLKENYVLVQILGAYTITKAEKKAIITRAFSFFLSANLVDLYLTNFFFLLIDHHLFDLILKIIIIFFEYINKHLNKIILEVFSPFALEQTFLDKIQEVFQKKTKKIIQTIVIIDRSLIGGLKIVFNNKNYDFTIKGKLEEIKFNLKYAK